MQRPLLLLFLVLSMACGCWARFPSDLLPDSGRDNDAPADLGRQDGADSSPDTPADVGRDERTDSPADDTGRDIAQDTATDGISDAPLPDTTADITPDVVTDGISDGPLPDTAADTSISDATGDGSGTDAAADVEPDTVSGCDALFQGIVPGYVLCQETATLCTFYFNMGAGSANCSTMCNTATCIGASDNDPADSCTVLPGSCEGKPCNCGTKLLDGLCTCSK